jgi:antitoxin component of MazEF toxin-antitoxin module
MDNVRNVNKTGNSRGITIPSYYWKYIDSTGRKIKAFSYEVMEGDKLILTPIFEIKKEVKKNAKKAKSKTKR